MDDRPLGKQLVYPLIGNARVDIVIPSHPEREASLYRTIDSIIDNGALAVRWLVINDELPIEHAWLKGIHLLDDEENHRGDYLLLGRDDVNWMHGFDLAAARAVQLDSAPMACTFNADGTSTDAELSTPFLRWAWWDLIEQVYGSDALVPGHGGEQVYGALAALGIHPIRCEGYRLVEHVRQPA